MGKVSLNVEMTAITENAELHCEKAARDCYDSISKMKDPNKSTNLVKSCTVSDHLTINGHAMATFRIKGLSRAASHQLVRHRHACFSQRSQRYIKEHDFDYVVPEAFTDSDRATFENFMDDIMYMYDFWIRKGYKAEDARAVLPNACATTLNMSMSFEGWLHFLRRRMDKHSQSEIRELAFEIYRQLSAKCPKIFNEQTLMADRKLSIDFSAV